MVIEQKICPHCYKHYDKYIVLNKGFQTYKLILEFAYRNDNRITETDLTKSYGGLSLSTWLYHFKKLDEAGYLRKQNGYSELTLKGFEYLLRHGVLTLE